MKKFIGAAVLAFSLAAAGSVSAAETLAVNDSFTNYESDGTTVPAGWSSSGDKVDGVDTAFRRAEADGNPYVQMFASGKTHRKVRLRKTKFASPVEKDYVLKFRMMTKYSGAAFIETPLLETNSGGVMHLKGSGTFSTMGGSAKYDASAAANGGKAIVYAPGNWYDVTVTSKAEGDNTRIMTYVDGVMRDNSLVSERGLTRENLSFIQLGINIYSGNAGSDVEMNIDDVKLYTAYNDLSIASGNVLDGAKNVDSGKDIEYYFNNDILPSSIGTIKVTGPNGEVGVTVTGVDKAMNGVKIHFDDLLEPNTDYTIDLSGVRDLMGGAMADGDIAFTTKDTLLGTEITRCFFEAGTVNAEIKFTNPTDKKAISAKAIAAVYDEYNVLKGLELLDVSLASGASATEPISIGDGNLERNAGLKIICVKDFESMTPAANVTEQKYIGKAITFPADFAEVPFEIYRDGAKSYSHNASPDKAFDESKALNVYISKDNVEMYGYTADKPTNITQFTANIQKGRYEGYTSFILNFVDEVMIDQIMLDLKALNISGLMLRSASPSGKTWFGKKTEISEWTAESENVYKTTAAGSEEILFPVNLKSVDKYGMPKPYDIVLSLEECNEKEGSCYISGRDVYINKYSDENISDIDVILRKRVLEFYNWTNQTVVVDGINFLGGQYKFQPTTTAAKLYVSNSKFYRGEVNAFYVLGAYNAYILDSVAAYASADGFNYHSTDYDSAAVEINCISYGNGKYKTKVSGSHAATHSNNGSTAHDSIRILRVGNKYWDCEGAIVIDINNCYSINIGCDARNVLPTTTGTCAGFSFANDDSGNAFHDTDQKKYVIDCYAGGDNLKNGGFRYDSNVLKTPVIGLDIEGTTIPDRPISFTITWDDIMNGNW